MLFEMSCKKLNLDIDRSITLEKYTEIWLQTIAPDKLAKSTLAREKQDIERFKPYLGSYKLVDLRPEHFRSLYTKLRKQKNKATGKPLSEATVEGVHSCLCGILSDAMEGGYGDCTEDTIVGCIAKDKGIAEGAYAYDPVFVLSAILDWAGIAHNKRGYLELTADYCAKAEGR